MKKLKTAMLIIIIAVGLILYIYPFSFKFEYEEYNGSIYIQQYNGYFPYITLPKTHNGTKISGMRRLHSSYCDLKKVVIPDGYDFETAALASHTKLEKVTLPSDITELTSNLFFQCNNLKSIDIPENVTRIGKYTFAYCSSLEDIYIPAAVSQIGSDAAEVSVYGNTYEHLPSGSAFAGCSSLKSFTVHEDNISFISVDGVLYSKDMSVLIAYPAAKTGSEYIIPDSVSRISANAFHSASALEKITIPPSVSEIDSGAFAYCEALKEINLPDGITVINDELFNGCVSLGKLCIPQEAEKIGKSAFMNCSSLESISIPDNTVTIGELAFYGCRSLSAVNISDNIAEIGNDAFANCTMLKGIYTAESNKHYMDIDGILFNKNGDVLLAYPAGKDDISDYRVPDCVTEISKNAFHSCSLRSIIYPPELKKQVIAPSYCENLEYLTIPESCANQLMYFTKNDGIKQVYDYTTDNKWTSKRVSNTGHIMLVLDGGSFCENWPYEQSLTKDGFRFIGWSTKSCDDKEYAGEIFDYYNRIFYAVFEEEQ